MTDRQSISSTRRAIVAGTGGVAALAACKGSAAPDGGRRSGFLLKTADYAITPADLGGTIVADEMARLGRADVAEILTLTLPAASAAPAGARIRIVKAGRQNFTRFQTRGGDRIGFDGLSVSIVDVTDNGSGQIRIRWGHQTGGGQAQQALFREGQYAEISGVRGVGAANGVWPVKQPPYEKLSLNYCELIGSRFSGRYADGGQMQMIKRHGMLITPNSFVMLESDGVSRWHVVEAANFHEIYPENDIVFGHVLSLPSAKNGLQQYNGLGSVGGSAGVALGVDGLFQAGGRQHTLSNGLHLKCIGDPIDLEMVRAGAVEGSSAFPYGPDPVATPAGNSIGSLYWSPDLGYLKGQPRSASISAVTYEAPTQAAHGTYIRIATTPVGSGVLTNQVWIMGRTIGIGAEDTTGKLSVYQTAETPALNLRATSLAYAHNVLQVQSDRVAGPTHNLAAFYAGNDLKAKIRADGAIFTDGAASLQGPADFGEMIRPWHDGNPRGEDRLGYAVVFVRADDLNRVVMPGEDDFDDVRLRLASDFPGVEERAIQGVTSIPTIAGATGDLRWMEKYLTDPFGRPVEEEARAWTWEEHTFDDQGKQAAAPTYVLAGSEGRHLWSDAGERPPEGTAGTVEDHQQRFLDRWKATGERPKRQVVRSVPVLQTLKRPKLNPQYDPERPYTPRRQRPEWDFVARCGQVAIRDGQPRKAAWTKVCRLAPGISRWWI